MTNGPNPTRVALIAAALVVTIAAVAPVTDAKRTSPCDNEQTHGVWTSLLCDNDHLVPNSYIKSPNEIYRLHLGDTGWAIVYDTTEYENWVPLWVFAAAVEGHPASTLAFGNDPNALGPFNWAYWSIYDEVLWGQSWSNTPDGAPYMKIDDDGCVRLYDDSGFFVGASLSAAIEYSAACQYAYSPGPRPASH